MSDNKDQYMKSAHAAALTRERVYDDAQKQLMLEIRRLRKLVVALFEGCVDLHVDDQTWAEIQNELTRAKTDLPMGTGEWQHSQTAAHFQAKIATVEKLHADTEERFVQVSRALEIAQAEIQELKRR